SSLKALSNPLTSPTRRLFVTYIFFHYTPTAEIYTLSLHDALPILWNSRSTSAEETNSTVAKPWLNFRAARKRCSRSSGSGSPDEDRKSTRLNSSHEWISYAVFCLKKKKIRQPD